MPVGLLAACRTGEPSFETAFHNAAAISPPGVLAPYAPPRPVGSPRPCRGRHPTGRSAQAAAHVAAARDCRLDQLSPRLRLVVLASAAITEPRTGTAALEQALTEPGNDRWPFDLARIQLAYGSPLRRVKRTTDARRQLASAAEIFHRLGATPWAARADGELRATGITVATAGTGLASLTPQQRQIALLAAAGHTNKEIAARLFLSPRTVSTHLYQVFPKLGITSRAALRDALADTLPEQSVLMEPLGDRPGSPAGQDTCRVQNLGRVRVVVTPLGGSNPQVTDNG